MIPGKHTVSFSRLFPAVFFADFGSNLVELCISESSLHTMTPEKAGYLLLIALFRTFLTSLILMAESHYRTLLKNEEHENRYRRLFLMTTGLKNEIYFMRKNSEEIESVMANAYKLYEKLNEMDVPDDMKHMSLSIARDVHEIKKDYIRIIQGIEEEISEEYDEKRMSFQDILKILEDTTYHMLEAKNVHIQLEFRCSDNFMTEEHYELMAVLKNLVNNAIEAIESDRKIGTICIEEHLRNGNYIFCVTDDGPGISPRHLPNIFKMGYSTKFDHKTGNIFRGVGLYGVKMTVEEQFNGNHRSEIGAGQRNCLYRCDSGGFPCGGRIMRIYIVEDDLSVINILEDIIETQGLGEICGDCGGEPANLSDVLRAKPDVVLVDFFMPVKDGVEFVKELRAVNTTVKCIMISQVSAKELISKAYSAGIDFLSASRST